MKILNIITASLATVLLGSCGLYSKYERPEVPSNTSEIMRDAALYANTTDSASFGDVAWREVFTDPQLQKLIQQGLDNNVDVYKAVAGVKQVEEALKCARLAFLPSLAFAPSGTLSKVLTGDYKSDWSKSYALPVSASWTIDIFGSILAQKRNAEMSLAMTKDYELAARSGIICGVANSYYTLLMLDRQLEILNEMEQLTKDTWEMMKLQYQLGRMRSTSVQSAEAAYLSTQTQANDFKRQIRATENALCLLIGQAGQQISRSTLAEQSLPSEFSTGVGMALLKNRPDVHNAEMQLAACFHDVQTARSKFYPSISVGFTGAFGNSGGSLNPGKWLTNLFGNLTQPIFNRGALTANLKVTKLQYEQAFNTWQNSILSAGNEVSNALVSYNSYDANSKLETQRITVLTKNVEDTRALYKSSGSSYLEVLTAQTQLLNAQLTKAADDFSKMQAVVSLYTALGGGWK